MLKDYYILLNVPIKELTMDAGDTNKIDTNLERYPKVVIRAERKKCTDSHHHVEQSKREDEKVKHCKKLGETT